MKALSSKMHFVEQHQELNDTSLGREQFAMHVSLIFGLKISGTEQHSMGNLETFGHVLQKTLLFKGKSSLGCGTDNT